jgi:sugar lactone lactonase YvrE
VDTLKGTIDAVEIGDDGALGERKPFVKIDPKDGHPDGPTIDSEGCVWISLYAGWEARRYSPAGELLESVRFPVANITKIAFGGADLRTAYATTARQMMSPEEIAKQPEIGDLFQFNVDVPGVPCPLVRY